MRIGGLVGLKKYSEPMLRTTREELLISLKEAANDIIELRPEDSSKKLYFQHTKHDKIEIPERKWPGVRL